MPTYRSIGLMSGTSMDGVDVALIETDGDATVVFGPTGHYPYSDATARYCAMRSPKPRLSKIETRGRAFSPSPSAW